MIPVIDLAFLLDLFTLLKMILNEKRCSKNTIHLGFDCPWKTEIHSVTSAKCFSTTAILRM